MARNYYDEWYDLMRMKPQFYNPPTGAAADKFHKGFFWPSSWQRPDEQLSPNAFLGHPFTSPTNLGITQQPRWSPGVQHSGMPVDEPTGIFGKSNLSGLVGDNKMAAALMALRGLEAGSRGQNILQAAAPAAMGGLSDAFIIEKYKDIKKKTKAKEKIQKSKAFTTKEKLMVEAGMKLPASSATAKMKDFSFFKNINWNNPIEVAAANAIYTGESKTKWMGKISASLAKREDLSDDEIKEKLTFFETIYDDTVGKTTTKTTTVEGLAIPANKSDLIDGQNYNVNGESLIWYEKENQFR
jgi:hypothetical protein|tara:strand:- start:620 stop:1513 length:894 start_codon:yes stop_codon:yes gene_type:complete